MEVCRNNSADKAMQVLVAPLEIPNGTAENPTMELQRALLYAIANTITYGKTDEPEVCVACCQRY